MNSRLNIRNIVLIVIIILSSLAIVSCGGNKAEDVAVAPVPPTDTPIPVVPPTDTPIPLPPTDTPTPLPPTDTPTPLPTPTSDLRLFYDDFEAGVKPEWNMTGNFAAVNGKLVAESLTEGHINEVWSNFAVTLNGLEIDICNTDRAFEIQLRIKNRDNYMGIIRSSDYFCVNYWKWFKVVDGNVLDIPGAIVDTYRKDAQIIKIEAEGNVYRLFIDGERILYFTDDTFTEGSFGIVLRGKEKTNKSKQLIIDDVEVSQLP